MKDNSKKEKTFIVIGSLFILIGILCNEWILTALFSPDGVIQFASRIKIWIFDIVCILLGYLFVKCRSLSINIGKFGKYSQRISDNYS